MDMDDDDPSEAWVSQSIGSVAHTPNGPLGSERSSISNKNHLGPLSPLNGNIGYSNGASAPRSQGIRIQGRKKKKEAAGSPLTNSVQENFRGFTYSGGESVVQQMSSMLGKRDAEDDEQAVDDEDSFEVTTEDEFETVGSVGRYANARRKGLGFSSLDGDEMS